MRRTSAGLAVLALAAASLVAQAPAAHAAINQSFDVETIGGSAPHNGSAHAWGTVSWQNRSHVVITGRINDRCPGDGYGAYLDVFIWFGDGGAIAKLDAATDTTGCDDPDGVAFSPISHNANRRIARIELRLREFDRQVFLSGDTASQTRHNPFG